MRAESDTQMVNVEPVQAPSAGGRLGFLVGHIAAAQNFDSVDAEANAVMFESDDSAS